MARVPINPKHRARKIASVFLVLQVGNLTAPSMNLTPNREPIS
jgi:hypothetical protein